MSVKNIVVLITCEGLAFDALRRSVIFAITWRHCSAAVSPTTAIVHGATEVPSVTPPEGHSIYTLVKEGNDWLIAAMQAGQAAPAP